MKVLGADVGSFIGDEYARLVLIFKPGLQAYRGALRAVDDRVVCQVLYGPPKENRVEFDLQVLGQPQMDIESSAGEAGIGRGHRCDLSEKPGESNGVKGGEPLPGFEFQKLYEMLDSFLQ
jgi:hypothetical protein